MGYSLYFDSENEIDFNNECVRLNKIMDKYDCVNIFLSEGAGVKTIIDEKIKSGETIEKDAFGHVRLDELNPGKWFAKEFADKLNANKVLIQKADILVDLQKLTKKTLNLFLNVPNKLFLAQQINKVVWLV